VWVWAGGGGSRPCAAPGPGWCAGGPDRAGLLLVLLGRLDLPATPSGESAPGPGSPAAATPMTGAAGAHPTRTSPGRCGSRRPPWGPAWGWPGPSQSATPSAQVDQVPPGPLAKGARPEGLVSCQHTAWRSVIGATTSSAGLGSWPPKRVAGIGRRTASPAPGAKAELVGRVHRGRHRRHRPPGARGGGLELLRGQRPGVEPGERCSAEGRRAGQPHGQGAQGGRVGHHDPTCAARVVALRQGIIAATAATWRSSGP
jgi:hypothetical protein